MIASAEDQMKILKPNESFQIRRWRFKMFSQLFFQSPSFHQFFNVVIPQPIIPQKKGNVIYNLMRRNHEFLMLLSATTQLPYRY